MNARTLATTVLVSCFVLFLALGCSSSKKASDSFLDPTYKLFFEMLAGTPTGQLRTLAKGDVDGDGFTDMVIGGQSFASGGIPGSEFEPVLLFRNDAGSTVTNISSQLVVTPPALADLDGNPKGFSPLARLADFNGDGKQDLAIFFWGYEARGLDNAYLGRPPLLYLSQPGLSTDLVYTPTLSVAVKTLRDSLVSPPRPCNVPYATTFGCDVFTAADNAINTLAIDGSELHVKAIDVGDIDGDGDLDITAETGGGFGTEFYLVAFINNGTGSFTASADRFPLTALKGPPTAGSGLPCSAPNTLHGTWRHFAHHLVDLNGDGALDMVMTALRNVRSGYNCDHGNLHSKIFINDGTGHFGASAELPDPEVFKPSAPPTNDNRTFNGQAIAYGDIVGSATPELVIVYTRSTDSAALNSTDWASTGRYVQILMDVNGTWEDVSLRFLGGQDTTLVSRYPRVMSSDPVLAAILTHNHGDARRVELVDINGDGPKDIVVSGFGAVISEFSPLIYLNEAATFTPFNPTVILAHPFAPLTGLMAMPFDVYIDG